MEQAISSVDVSQVHDILQSGFDVNKCRDYCTPIMFAAVNNKPEIIQLLLEHGANVNYQSSFYKDTALLLTGKLDRSDIYRKYTAMHTNFVAIWGHSKSS